jgi:hypothetical protein
VPTTKTAPKLNTAAHSTAICGVKTRVATTVAIEFAASWKPLMKSNAERNQHDDRDEYRAWNPCVAMSLTVLDLHVLERVRDVFAVVRGLLQEFVNFLELDQPDRVLFVLEQVLDSGPAELIRRLPPAG